MDIQIGTSSINWGISSRPYLITKGSRRYDISNMWRPSGRKPQQNLPGLVQQIHLARAPTTGHQLPKLLVGSCDHFAAAGADRWTWIWTCQVEPSKKAQSQIWIIPNIGKINCKAATRWVGALKPFQFAGYRQPAVEHGIVENCPGQHPGESVQHCVRNSIRQHHYGLGNGITKNRNNLQ